jgi:hypothetical protein
MALKVVAMMVLVNQLVVLIVTMAMALIPAETGHGHIRSVSWACKQYRVLHAAFSKAAKAMVTVVPHLCL